VILLHAYFNIFILQAGLEIGIYYFLGYIWTVQKLREALLYFFSQIVDTDELNLTKLKSETNNFLF